MLLNDFLKEWRNGEPCLTVKTSGSTGTPKTMLVEKERMLNSARITCDFLGLTAADTALLCMNLNYIGAKMMVVRSLDRGMKLVTVPPSGHPYADLPAEFRALGRITFAAMVPLQVYNALQVPEETEWLRSIDHLIIGGGGIDERVAQQLKTFPKHVWSTYGMTETLSHIALRRLNGPDASEWYRPFDTVKVGRDAEGCLTIDAPMVHDGLLVTNDRVELLSDGAFRILGRKDNVIVSGGIKIQIEEVEHTLRPFMDKPFLITKAPSEKFGEAVVILTEETDMGQVEEICLNTLPKYWVPRKYVHVDKLPMTETGKPARFNSQFIIHNS
ncbi:O-succinylbenzoic acid--CoA ligase family protein [Bacteroidales bacterium KA00344]|nr:O-succinylbenzoic acid--CoA ligase family protein [Bacteroidales bacterium KA00344]